MYLNAFKFHVQDRNYNRAEVINLINNENYKHFTLSGGQYGYSAGTIAETVFWPVKIVGVILEEMGKADQRKQGFNPDLHYFDKYKVTDIDKNELFTGREVTAFMNKYYDYKVGSPTLNKVYYDNMVEEFLSHQYVNAEVPTSDHSSVWDWHCAVLDQDYVL